jgi:regulation of enolase protein 1 (concanavalin A-like superfamily)
LIGSIGAEGNKLQVLRGWGEVIDPDRDCHFSLTNGKLTISIPGTVHGLAVERGNMSAPRVLQEVSGDFVAQVEVSGAFAPGATSLVSERRAFQAAGLLLWQDSRNYVRLERAQLGVEGQTMTYASFELRSNGQIARFANASEHPLPGNVTLLKLERHGHKVSASVSSDGVQWTSLEPMVVHFSKTVRVGVAAGHNTSTPLTAEFERFTLTPAAEASGSETNSTSSARGSRH